MFDFARFRRLAAAHWAEYRRAYAWFFGIGMIVQFVLVLIILSMPRGYTSLTTDGQGTIYFCGLFLTAPIFAGRYFQAMARRESALVLMMRPASIFEKWLLAIIVIALLYPLVYTLAFYVCDVPAWLIAASQVQHALALLPKDAPEESTYLLRSTSYTLFVVWQPMHLWQFLGWNLMLAPFEAFAVLGSLYFRAMPFIKTILAAFFVLLASIFLSAIFDSNPTAFLGFWDNSTKLDGWQRVFFPSVWFGVPLLLWLSCLFALQEREIV